MAALRAALVLCVGCVLLSAVGTEAVTPEEPFVALVEVQAHPLRPDQTCTKEDASHICGHQYACSKCLSTRMHTSRLSRTRVVCSVDGRCAYCRNDADCSSAELRCFTADSPGGHNTCEHKRLFDHFDSADALSSLFIFVAAFLAAGGGVGGGSLFVPIFILFAGFGPHAAVPLSKSSVFGGAVANLIL